MEYEPVMMELVRKVVRKFYEPHHVVITDILLRNTLLYDTELCERMKMLAKEFNRLVIRLKEDKIIKYETKVESKEDNRQLLRTVYYINYAEARDVIKYKVFMMTRMLESSMRMAQMEGYICTECSREYSSLDAQSLMENFVFKCEGCKGDLVENRRNSGSDCMAHTVLMAELDDIIRLLKETDKFSIPSMDYFQVLETKKSKERMHSTLAEEEEVAVPIVNVADFDVVEAYVSPEEPQEGLRIDEMVSINGVKKKFSEVTDEDKELMNEDEYERYFEIYSKHNSGDLYNRH
jgi:transcription initiation factor TFIIE subunit alpha